MSCTTGMPLVLAAVCWTLWLDVPDDPSGCKQSRQNAGPTEVVGSLVEPVDLQKPLRRRPLRVVLCGDPARVLVANRESGSVSVMDPESLEILGEWKVASRIGDLTTLANHHFLVTEHAAPGALICLRFSDRGGMQEVWRCSTLHWPGRMVVNREGNCCYVAGLWSRQVACHPLAPQTPTGPVVAESLLKADLDFPVGDLLLIDQQNTLLASDAFGGRWASLDSRDMSAVHAGDLGSQRICSMAVWPAEPSAVDPQVALVAQPLNRLAQAVRNDVHWGLMVANELVIKDQRWFIDPNWQEPRRTTIPLGGPGEAKGDPESIAVSSRGEVALAIGGVQQVAIGDLVDRSFAYLATGTRPVDVCFDPTGKTAFVANQLDDSITVVDVENYEVRQTVKLGVDPPATASDRGERLFFNARVSHDGWMSCHSCHVRGHTTGFLNDNFSDQSFGAPKRVLSLLGHGDTAPFAWNGSAATLEEQVESSIKITMQTDDVFAPDQIADLAAFVRDLPAPPSLAAARGEQNQSLATTGRTLFAELGCAECHREPTYTTPALRIVGVQDELGESAFNPPSLIGVSQRDRFFHDGRYASLSEVFAGPEGHQLSRQLSRAEMQALMAFLRTL